MESSIISTDQTLIYFIESIEFCLLHIPKKIIIILIFIPNIYLKSVKLKRVNF